MAARLRITGRWPLVAGPLALMVVFFVLPYLNLLAISFFTPSRQAAYVRSPTLSNYAAVLHDSLKWQAIWHTFWLGALTTLITLAISYPLAYHLARVSRRWQGPLMVLIISPLLVGVLIRVYGWMIILADTGLVNQLLEALHLPHARLMYNDTGVLIGLVHVYVPFMVLSLAGPMQAINPDLERAARSLGAGAWRAFWRVTLPLSLPGVTAGTVLVFVLSVSSYVIPSLLGGFKVLTVPILVIQTVTENFNWPGGSAFAIFFFAATLLVVWLYLRLMGRLTRMA